MSTVDFSTVVVLIKAVAKMGGLPRVAQQHCAIRFNLFANTDLAYRQKGFPLLSLADASTQIIFTQLKFKHQTIAQSHLF